jgi:phosphonate transport system substrate-binding protein
VAHKKVDAGALDETVYQKMVKDGKLNSSQVKIFYTTPPFYDYVWAARKGLDPRLADTFAAAFLKLDANDPAHKVILDLLNAAKYVKAEDDSYDKLRQAARDSGLLK